MPPKSKAKKFMARKTQTQKGGNFGDFLKKAGKWIKDNKIVSRGLSAVSPFLGTYSGLARGASVAANLAGWVKCVDQALH